MSTAETPRRRSRHPHDDAPDTAASFARLAQMPPGPARQALSEELVAAWLPMAHRLAGRFRNRGEPLEDLQQVAALGLVKAVEGYDPDRGGAFEAYAIPTIIGEIKRYFRDHSWHVHVPRRVKELRSKVRRAVQELATGIDDRAPTVAQLAAHTGLCEEDVLLAMEALGSYRSMSLDAELGPYNDGQSLPLLDTLGHEEPSYDHVLARESVKPLLQELPEREKRILYLHYFQELPQRCIGEELGISQMHVSRLLSRTYQQLRRHAERETPRRTPAPDTEAA